MATTSRAADRDPHQGLRDDVRLLGELLGEAIQMHGGTELFDRVERVRAFAKRVRAGDGNFEQLAAWFRTLPTDGAVPIARAFSQFLALANIAEQHHRVRRRREYASHRGAAQPGSCDEAFHRFLRAGASADRLAEAVRSLRIGLVLTAHPTEIVRRTLIHKHNRIAAALSCRDRTDLTSIERDEAVGALRAEIAAAWETDEVRAQTVSPLDEVRAGLIVFEQTLWDAVPRYLRALDRALIETTGETLPLDAAPIRFGSWIGGDRDGNPAVTPEVTRQATWLARWMAADLYAREVRALRDELSLTAADDQLRALAVGAREPYRAVLRTVADRLDATRQWATDSLSESPPRRGDAEPYLDVDAFAGVLQACYRSLVATRNEVIASRRLLDILRRVATFGLTLARLDLRQEAGRHADAVDWLMRERGRGPFLDIEEIDRVGVLTRELTAPTFTLADVNTAAAPPGVRDVLETFQTAARLHRDDLGAYVITMASRASDVLAVEFLQRAAGSPHPQRVVPLFETTRDLERAADVLDTLCRVPWYRARIDGRQEVMIGYSDSAKDAGRFAAAWALYRAQEQMVACCARHGVSLTLFHGRGGSVGRGGGPTYLAISSQPPGSVDGTMRVTEQGEMIQAKFGVPDIALRTLEVYTTAVLDAMLTPRAEPPPRWRSAMDRLSQRARLAYRAAVYDDARFLEYFHVATPEPELRTIHIGSRPARRSPRDGVETLRAIPWQFAWTQTRLLLASWLGLEAALEEADDNVDGDGDAALAREMYEGWPFFRATIDLMEMVLAKADARIAAEYDRRLVPANLQPIGADLRERLARAIAVVQGVTGHARLADSNPVLRRAIDLRNPYVDPINLVQIEMLDRLRQAGDDPRLHHALVITVNGIAAGMRNTG